VLHIWMKGNFLPILQHSLILEKTDVKHYSFVDSTSHCT
jgi:hypothetical protein